MMRGVFAESVLLTLLGGAAGVAVAHSGMDWLLAMAPEDAVAGLHPSIDSVVWMFSAAVAGVAAVLFAMAPMWWVARAGLDGGRSTTMGRARTKARSLLVVAETALALVLLVTGGLFLRSLERLEAVHPGFDAKGVMLAWITPPQGQYPSRGAKTGARDELFRGILQELRSSPAVASAALGSLPPFTEGKDAGKFEIEGREGRQGQLDPHGNSRRVAGDYFQALGISLKQGRFLGDQDRQGSEPVVVIDENLAREYWPGVDPVGKRMRREGDAWFRVVGVVGHVLDSSLATDDGKGTYYVSLFQQSAPAVAVIAKTNGEVSRMPAAIREAVLSADSSLPVHTMRSMEDAVARSLAPRRFGMQLIGFFAGVGLFLAALGLYGVIGYSVAQRAREIGIRMALGAERRGVLALVVGQGLRLASIGAAIGLVGSVAVGQWLGTQLYGVSAFDPVTLGSMVGMLLIAAAMASYLPARRAVRIDPAIALRPE
jgi:putative ABC transport system permease protein